MNHLNTLKIGSESPFAGRLKSMMSSVRNNILFVNIYRNRYALLGLLIWNGHSIINHLNTLKIGSELSLQED